jgi:hypothetical protein
VSFIWIDFPPSGKNLGFFLIAHYSLKYYESFPVIVMLFSNPETPIPYCDLDLLQKVLVFYGARVTSTINDETTHIIVSENDLSRVDKLKQKVNEMLAGYEVKPIILLQSWVTQSCSQHSLLDETNFQISL